MIQFLHTSFLYGLAACTIPVIIHFFAKRRRKHIIFSSLIFLQEMKTRQLKILKIKEILLLVLRVMAILFLVLAFSQPVITTFKNVNSSETVIMFDRSLSMERSTIFDKAKDVIGRLIGNNGLSGNISICFFPDEDNRILSGENTDLISIIKSKKTSEARPAIAEDVNHVLDFFNNKAETTNKELVIVTDNQESTWKNRNDSLFICNFTGRVYVVPLKDSTENIGVANVTIHKPILSVKKGVKLIVHIENFDESSRKDMLVRLLIDDKSVQQKLVSFASREQKRVEFEIDKQSFGWHTVEILLDQDDFNFDNKRYFSFYMPSDNKIFIIGNKMKDTVPLELAIDTEPDIHNTQIFLTGQKWQDCIDSCSVLIFSNYPFFSVEESGKVLEFLNNGNGVLFFPGGAVDLRNLVSCDFWPQKEWKIQGVDASGSLGNSFFSVQDIDADHPVFSGVFRKKGRVNIMFPKIFKRVMLKVSLGENIVSFTDGKPFIAEKKIGIGRMLFTASGLGRDWADLQLSSFFPVFVNSAAQYLSPRKFRTGKHYFTGNYVKVYLKNPEGLSQYKVISPNNDEILLSPIQDKHGYSLDIGRLWRRGNYKLLKDDKIFEIVNVNVDPAESDFSSMDINKYKNIFPDARVKVIDDDKNFVKIIQEDRFGKPLWKFFLFIALTAFVAEMFLSSLKRKNA